MRFKIRKPAHKIAYNKRHLAMDSNSQVKCRILRRMLYTVLAKREIDGCLSKEAEDILKGLSALYAASVISAEDDSDDLTQESRERDVDSFTESACRINFRFLKKDLHKLVDLLQFPEVAIFPNRSTMSGEEAFLRGLYELVSGENQQKACSNVFGANQPVQSFAFAFFIDHIYGKFRHLVQDNLKWWHSNGFFASSAEAIGNKTGIRGNRVAHFIDCNCLSTSVPGGGPAQQGANSLRWDDDIQRAFYNGWKSIHGLKHQTVDNAYGCTVDMSQACSLRNNDMRVFHRSRINDRMREVQELDPEDEQYIIMGDSAYLLEDVPHDELPSGRASHSRIQGVEFSNEASSNFN